MTIEDKVKEIAKLSDKMEKRGEHALAKALGALVLITLKGKEAEASDAMGKIFRKHVDTPDLPW